MIKDPWNRMYFPQRLKRTSLLPPASQKKKPFSNIHLRLQITTDIFIISNLSASHSRTGAFVRHAFLILLWFHRERGRKLRFLPYLRAAQVEPDRNRHKASS